MATTIRQSSVLEASYSEDVDTGALPGQLSILEVMLKEKKISCFDEILLVVLKFPEAEKNLIQEVQTVRLVKTWRRSRMGDERFSNLVVLQEWSQAENRQCLYC